MSEKYYEYYIGRKVDYSPPDNELSTYKDSFAEADGEIYTLFLKTDNRGKIADLLTTLKSSKFSNLLKDTNKRNKHGNRIVQVVAKEELETLLEPSVESA